MPDELRLVRTTFGELAAGQDYIMVETVADSTRIMYDKSVHVPDSAAVRFMYPQLVYAVRPAEPPVDRARVLAVLRYAEWSRYSVDHQQYQCPKCWAFKNAGHKADCELAAVIALLEGDV